MPTIPYKNAKGQRISGVTTIIGQNLGWNKQQLMWWANQMGQEGKSHRDVAGEAADAGTIGHYLIDCHIHKVEPDTSNYQPKLLDLAETCLLNYLEWEKMVNLEVVETEINLVSEVFQFGGTPDIIGRLTGKLAVIDLKTSNGTYPDMLLQLAAYKVLWEGNKPDMPLTGGFHLLRVGKEDASFHHHHWDKLPEPLKAFLYCLELHKSQKIIKKLV